MKSYTRRDLVGMAAGLACAAVGLKAARAGAVTADVPDLPSPPRKILLGDGHLLLALALVHPNPGSIVCGWQGDLVRHSKEIFQIYGDAFPALKEIPVVGEASPETFSVEAALATRPDVVLLGGCYGPGPEDTAIVQRLENAGIPVVFVDFYDNPLQNTAPSMRSIGKLLGGDAKAKANRFAQLHDEATAHIRDRVTDANPPRPTVMIQANAGAPGWDCCWVPGGGGLGTFVELAGGTNIGGRLSADRPWVQARKEFILGSDPSRAIVTGGNYLAGRGGIVIGPTISREAAVASLLQVAAEADTAPLSAFRGRRLGGLWHFLHATPFNAIAAQALAKWIHPDLFGHLDPAGSMAAINRDFLAAPLEGTYSVDLQA